MSHICRAIIVAAGKGQRMGGDIPKQFLKLAGKPIIAHTLKQFDSMESIDDIVLVIDSNYAEYMQRHILDIYEFKKTISLVEGSDTRQKSVYNGLKSLPRDTDIAIIHDGVRPFIQRELIEMSIHEAIDCGGAVVGVPVKDTIKRVDGDGFIRATLDRKMLWAVQTPQTFKYDIIIDAHRQAMEDGFVGTDDSMLVERLGISVKMLMGSYSNIKITTKEDIILANALINGGRVGI